MSFLDLFFPKRCVVCKSLGTYICPTCFSRMTLTEGAVCVVCQKAAISGITHPLCKKRHTIDGVLASIIYNQTAKKLIYSFKYKPYLSDLQSILGDFFYEGLIQKEQFYRLLNKKTMLIPIPLHPSRLRSRGYNQSLLLAKELGKRFDLEVCDILERTKKTHTQVGLSKEERQKNIAGAFRIKEKEKERVKTIKQVFLIDDVVTSGATFLEAAKVLKKEGVECVWGVALAHGQ